MVYSLLSLFFLEKVTVLHSVMFFSIISSSYSSFSLITSLLVFSSLSKYFYMAQQILCFQVLSKPLPVRSMFNSSCIVYTVMSSSIHRSNSFLNTAVLHGSVFYQWSLQRLVFMAFPKSKCESWLLD